MKSFFTLVILFCLVSFCNASPVDSIKAKKAAAHLFSKIKTSKTTPILNRVKWSSRTKSTSINENIPALYIFNNEADGFVIVSGNDKASPILAYSSIGKIDPSNIPPALNEWIKWKESEIASLSSKDIQPLKNASAEWTKIEGNLYSTQIVMGGKEPLIKTNWGQGTNYNDLCPIDSASGYSNYRTPVGCVATVMAQIMKYWEYPVTGTGSHSYTLATYGVQSANYAATTYNWASMPNTISAVNNAVATLSYHCGVSVNMSYGPSGSSASLSTATQSLVTYFNYKNTISYIKKTDYTANAWNTLIKTDIDNYMPVLLRGASSDGSGGHAYICDGYTIDNYFHINWGWNGSYNGYFLFDDLTPGTSDFRYYQYATIGIKPNSSSCAVYPALLSINSGSGSTGNMRVVSNASWTASSDQTWLTIGSASGSGSGSITLTANSQNTTGANRTAIVSISIPGLPTKTVTITQLPTTTTLPNLSPYKPSGWSDKIVLSNTKGTTTDNTLTQNDSVYMDFSFSNLGSANITSTFYCWMSLDSITLFEGIKSGLNSGYYSTFRDYALGKLPVGTHKIKMVIDPLGEINETNEADNIYMKQFTISNTTSNINGVEQSKVKIFPNPAKDWLYIDCNGSKIEDISIFNSTGTIIRTKMRTDNEISVSIADLKPGYYIISYKINKTIYRETFIKQ